jgi:uncharacterized SAM-binding protein YcdF (DUF218 family)
MRLETRQGVVAIAIILLIGLIPVSNRLVYKNAFVHPYYDTFLWIAISITIFLILLRYKRIWAYILIVPFFFSGTIATTIFFLFLDSPDHVEYINKSNPKIKIVEWSRGTAFTSTSFTQFIETPIVGTLKWADAITESEIDTVQWEKITNNRYH